MIDKARILLESKHFFEWPGQDHSTVTVTSMLIFCNVIAEMARAEEREACAVVCDVLNAQHGVPRNPAVKCAQGIRKRKLLIG